MSLDFLQEKFAVFLTVNSSIRWSNLFPKFRLSYGSCLY